MIDNDGRTGATMSEEFPSTACLAPLALYMIRSYIVCVCMEWRYDVGLGLDWQVTL